jgi:predicted site-specific integrase-resolvase
MRKTSIPKEFMRTYEAKELLCMSKHTLHKCLKNGVIKSIRLNGIILIPINEIERLKNEAK